MENETAQHLETQTCEECDEAAAAKLRARMRIAEYEREHGLAEDAFEATERIMEKHGLQN